MVVRTDAPAPAGTTSHRTSADRTGQAQAAAVWARWLDMWNVDPEIAHEIIGDGYRVHLPSAGATLDASTITDAAGMASWVRSFRGRFDGLRYRTDIGPLVDGDTFVCRWVGTATFLGRTGWPNDVPGRPVTWVGVDILRLVDGLIAEAWTQGAETTSV